MKLEQVLPQLRDGAIITRTKPFKHEGSTVIFVKMDDTHLRFKCIWSNGEEMETWAYYRFRTEDIWAENWEIAG
jgi:hypothetical protein